MSFLQSFTRTLPSDPLRLSLVAGVASSSYFIFGNLALANLGIIPAIQDHGAHTYGADFTVADKVALWSWYTDKAKVCIDFTSLMYTLTDMFPSAVSYGWFHSYISHLIHIRCLSFLLPVYSLHSVRHSSFIILCHTIYWSIPPPSIQRALQYTRVRGAPTLFG